jgi:hypothetical protein
MKIITFIIIMFIAYYNTISQEIVNDKSVTGKESELLIPRLLKSNNNLYILCMAKKNDDMYGVSVLKFDNEFNEQWEYTKFLGKPSFAQLIYPVNNGNIKCVANTGNTFRNLYSFTVDKNGNLTYEIDSVTFNNNFLFQKRKLLLNFNKEIYHIFNIGTNSSAQLRLQKFDTNASYYDIDTIFHANDSLYKTLSVDAVTLTKDSGFVVVSSQQRKSPLLYDLTLLKYDKNVSLKWKSKSEAIDTIRYMPNFIYETNDEKLLLIGNIKYYTPHIGKPTVFMRMYNNDGSLLWHKEYSDSLSIIGFDIAETEKGNFYISGNSYQQYFDSPPETYYNFCLMKFDSNGKLLWEKIWGLQDTQNRLHQLHVINDNEVIVAGDQNYKFIYLAKIIDTTKVDVLDKQKKVSDFLLFPNPISIDHNINISYSINTASKIKLDLFNSQGIKISEIFNGYKEQGEHTIQFNPPQTLPSGAYWIKMLINGESQITKPLIIML